MQFSVQCDQLLPWQSLRDWRGSNALLGFCLRHVQNPFPNRKEWAGLVIQPCSLKIDKSYGFLAPEKKKSSPEKQKIKCLEIWNQNIILFFMKMHNRMTPWPNSLHSQVTKTVSSQLGEQPQLSLKPHHFIFTRARRVPAGSCLVFTTNFFSIDIFEVLSTDRC